MPAPPLRIEPPSPAQSGSARRGGGDRDVAVLASQQHGVVTRRQLLEAGFSRHMIGRRLRDGWLHELHAGAYAVGHPGVSERGRLLAAVLVCGARALLSHRSAAELWQIVDPISGPIHVTVPWRDGGRPGMILHRPRRLEADEQTVLGGIPITTVARTLVDFAAAAGPARLRSAVDEAARKRILDVATTHRLCIPGRRGARRLRALLEAHRPLVAETASPLEARFLALLEASALPMPAVNVPIGRYVVDCFWRGARLVVELDSYEHHGHRPGFERDRRRDAELRIAGYTVLRFTSRQIDYEPAYVIKTLRSLHGAPADPHSNRER